MAAQVEVQAGEVGRTGVGGRLHLSPLTDSSNKTLIDIPPINQSHLITSEPNKPAPGPKPRLSPKPFSVERNPTIKPILAPKPQPKPRPESAHLPVQKPEFTSSPKPQQLTPTGKPTPVSTNPNRSTSTALRTSKPLSTGQTTKPVVHPFKPAPPLVPADPSKPSPPVPVSRPRPSAPSLAYPKSFRKLPAAEWSGSTKNENEKDQTGSSKGGTSIARAKSMGSLDLLGQEEEENAKSKPEAAVQLRPQPRGSRTRPVSAIFLDSPNKTEAPVPTPRWTGRRPLSADLTSKFESIGLSLHHRPPKANTKENTPEEKTLQQKKETEKTPKSAPPQSLDEAMPAVLDQSNKKTEEVTAKEPDESKKAVSIKKRISLLLDSSSSPVAGTTGQQVSEVHTPVPPVPEAEPAVGVKQLIKQLTEDTTPTQSPVHKPPVKPRPLPLDLTKRFTSERSPDPCSEATERHDISRDPQTRTEETAVTPSEQRTFADLKDPHQPLIKDSMEEGPAVEQTVGAALKDSGEVQKVRASLFENVVERHSVMMVEENKAKDSLNSPLLRRESSDEGTLVTAVYKEPVSPSSPLRVLHSFDTVQAVDENRAVSESVPSAHREDKAMTLRSRRSEASKPTEERNPEPALSAMPEQQPRYLRIGALPKWSITGLGQEAGKEPQQEGQVALDTDTREAEQGEVAAAPKRLKMLPADEQHKPRATYFALTGQAQEPASPGFDMNTPFDDLSAVRSAQGKVQPIRRNPSLDEACGKNSQDQVEPSTERLMAEEKMEVEKRRELIKEAERKKTKLKELEREKQRQLELEKEAHIEFERMKERERQREFERQRQRAYEKEKQEFEEKQRALERQKQIELEKQKIQELEREKQERERQRQLEKEKQRELERQRKLELEKMREQEKERQREQERQRKREAERQRELDRERQLMEMQKEKQRMEELERLKEIEKQQLLEFQKQKQKEKERQQIIEMEKQRLREKMEREEAEKVKQMALEQEMLRLRELEKERERQREMEREMEREKQRELERQRQRELDKERQRQLDIERQELENQRQRQREQEKERLRKEEIERVKEIERRQLLEFEKQKQAERERQQIMEMEKRRLREKMEREEADKMRLIAKQQEAERQRLKEKQKKEEQERARLEAAALRPKVVDLDSVLRLDPFPKTPTQRSDPATRWKEPSLKAEESYKPAILDIDSFTSQAQLPPTKDLFPVSGIQSADAVFGARVQPSPERDISWKVPTQPAAGLTSPVWTTGPQDPWELRPVEMSVDSPTADPRKTASKTGAEQVLNRLQESRKNWSVGHDEQLHLKPLARTEAETGGSAGGVSSSTTVEQLWLPREPHPPDSRPEGRSHRRSHGAQELNRMRSRSMSRRSAPSSSALEGSLSRMRSRSAHREQDRSSWEQQKQAVGGEEEGKDSETPVHETDSQYGTWETGLRTDDSLTPATPSSESNLSPSPRKPTPPDTPGDSSLLFDTDTVDSLPPSSSSESQSFSFPDAQVSLLDTSALRSRAQLGKKRAPRTRPSRAALQTAVQEEDWLFRDSTEPKVEAKDDDSDSEEPTRGADAASAVASQPQRVALFPGMDPSALKAQLKKRGDSDNQTDGPAPSPSQLSRSPKSPFLPRAARVLPPPGGKENGEEDSPQWLKELKSKKRLSQYENES